MQFMKVFYNESCSISRAEINLYKKQNIKEIEWVEITQNKLAEKETHQDNKALHHRMHEEFLIQCFLHPFGLSQIW